MTEPEMVRESLDVARAGLLSDVTKAGPECHRSIFWAMGLG